MLYIATMFIDDSTVLRNGRSYRRVLLRETFWEDGKVKHRTLANLSRSSDEEVAAMRLALQHKGNLADLASVKANLSLRQGPSVGAVWLLHQLANRLGITRVLGQSHQARLALWQVIARTLDQGSRLSAVRLAASHCACEILRIEAPFNEDDLYENLTWLWGNQPRIEQELYRLRRGDHPCRLFLYDVTSSYLEGNHNELADFGYNRDDKEGKRQIVIGLLCDDEGVPVSIEVFKGNTGDLKTFGSQIRKVAHRFDCKQVTFVGDRGMIKSSQIGQLRDQDFHYVTALTKVQIEARLKSGLFQLGLFDENLAEVEADGVRYVMRRNPQRAAELAETRQAKRGKAEELVRKKDVYLRAHQKAKVDTAIGAIQATLKRLRIHSWLIVKAVDRTITLEVDQAALEEDAKLDGCYCLKTDLSKDLAPKTTVHDRYKDLSLVEWAFRTAKTVLLEVRPVFVRSEEHTRAHVFVVMLAYILVRHLAQVWSAIDMTVEEGLKELDSLCAVEVLVKGNCCCYNVPEPRGRSRELLKAADVRLPDALPRKGIDIATRKKLTSRRKAA